METSNVEPGIASNDGDTWKLASFFCGDFDWELEIS